MPRGGWYGPGRSRSYWPAEAGIKGDYPVPGQLQALTNVAYVSASMSSFIFARLASIMLGSIEASMAGTSR
jgi:hypothetical protein